jgi:hypothetical protein
MNSRHRMTSLFTGRRLPNRQFAGVLCVTARAGRGWQRWVKTRNPQNEQMWSAVHRKADIAGTSGHSHTTPDSRPSGTWLEGANVRPAGGIMTVKENHLSYTVREIRFFGRLAAPQASATWLNVPCGPKASIARARATRTQLWSIGSNWQSPADRKVSKPLISRIAALDHEVQFSAFRRKGILLL